MKFLEEENIKINKIKSDCLIEKYEYKDDNYLDVGQIIAGNEHFCLMRKMDVYGVFYGYVFSNFDSKGFYFKKDTDYIKQMEFYREMAEKNKLIDVCEPTKIIKDLKKFDKINKNPLRKLLRYFEKNGIVCEVELDDSENSDDSIDGIITSVKDTDFSVKSYYDFKSFDNEDSEEQTLQIDDIQQIHFNSWQNIFEKKLIEK